jgi:hypothetical protein
VGKFAAALGCVAFAAVFGGVGVFATWAIGATLWDAHRAGSWVRVKATVGDAALQSGGDTFRAEGTYRYTFEGREYSGSRLGISRVGGADNLDDWHQEVSAKLQDARAAGKAITVWVNPENPAEAVFDRYVRWREIAFLTPFSLAFGGVGVGALVAAVVVLLGSDRKAPARAPVPEREGRDASPAFLWAFAFLWNALSFPIAILVISDVVESGEWAGLLVLLFPLVGIGLLWAAVSVTWAAWRARRGRDGPALRPPDRAAPRTLPGAMATQAGRAMFDPAGKAFASAPDPAAAVAIPASLAQLEESGGGLTIRYSRRRRLGLAVAFFVVGALLHLGGATLFAGGEVVVGAALFLGLGTLADLAGVAVLLGTLVVAAKGGELSVEKAGLFGSRSWRVRRESITAIRPALAYSVVGTPYFSLFAETGGERIPLGNSLKGTDVADAVARRIARALGASPSIVKHPGTLDREPIPD